MARVGFESLTQAELERVIESYRNGLDAYEKGTINFPCGEKVEKVRRWLKTAESMLKYKRDTEGCH